MLGVEMGQIPARSLKAYAMRKEGKSWEEIGKDMGVKPLTARNYVGLCGKEGMEPLKHFRAATAEGVNPEKTAEILFESIGWRGLDLKKFLVLCEEAGLPRKAALALHRRMMTGYAEVNREVRAYKGQVLLEEIQGAMTRAVDEMKDPEKLSGASLRDLSVNFGIMVDKLQLLGGRPTAIYDVQVSHRMEELMPQFLEEARRRGITVDGGSGEVIEE